MTPESIRHLTLPPAEVSEGLRQFWRLHDEMQNYLASFKSISHEGDREFYGIKFLEAVNAALEAGNKACGNPESFENAFSGARDCLFRLQEARDVLEVWPLLPLLVRIYYAENALMAVSELYMLKAANDICLETLQFRRMYHREKQ